MRLEHSVSQSLSLSISHTDIVSQVAARFQPKLTVGSKSKKYCICTNFPENWQVGRGEESKLVPPLRKMAVITCSRRQQPDGQSADIYLHTRHQMSLCPAKLYGDTRRLWSYWWRVCRGQRMQITRKQALLVLLFMEQLVTWRAVTLVSRIEEGSLWTGWPPCPKVTLSLFPKWWIHVWDIPAKSGKKEILMIPMFPQPHCML